jgi:hypothetical protein
VGARFQVWAKLYLPIQKFAPHMWKSF